MRAMHLLNWIEFAKCEVGTIFQIIGHGSGTGDLQILGGIIVFDGEPRDFVSAPLLPEVMYRDNFGGSSPEALVKHPDAPAFVVVPSGHGRDGLFDHERRSWLVWDEEDRRRLAGWLLNPAEAADQQNDDPSVLLPLTVEQAFLA